MAFICGLPYVLLAGRPDRPVEPLAAPVLEGGRYEDRPIYFSDVIVRADAPLRSFADLRGRSWAYNEPYSHSGYNVTRHHLVRLGKTAGFFGEVIESGYHLASIRLVEDGLVDASAIDSQVLAIELRDRPGLQERLRIIDALGPATIQPVVAAARLPASLKEDLRAALVQMHRDPRGAEGLAHGFVTRFQAVEDADYDDIREMAGAAHAAGFTTLR